MKSALYILKHHVENTLSDLNSRYRKGKLSVEEVMQEMGEVKFLVNKLINEYK